MTYPTFGKPTIPHLRLVPMRPRIMGLVGPASAPFFLGGISAFLPEMVKSCFPRVGENWSCEEFAWPSLVLRHCFDPDSTSTHSRPQERHKMKPVAILWCNIEPVVSIQSGHCFSRLALQIWILLGSPVDLDLSTSVKFFGSPPPLHSPRLSLVLHQSLVEVCRLGS